MARQSPVGQGLVIVETSRSHSDTHTHTRGRTSLDEWSVRRRYLYLATHTTQKRQTSMPSAGFEPTFSVGEAAADRATTGAGRYI